MNAALKNYLTSIAEYLVDEIHSPIKREFVGGAIYQKTDERNAHQVIASNALGALGSRLRGKRCRALNSDTKIRVRLPQQTRFYYPDASVVCRPSPQSDLFQDEPAVIVEVLSRATRRLDEGEKKDAYFAIPSLSVYLLVEQELAAVVAFRRTEQGFLREVYADVTDVIPLPEIDAELPLAEIYEGVEFVPEADASE